MRRPGRRHPGEPQRHDPTHATRAVWEEDYSLGEECAAYLSGGYLDWCSRASLPVRPWMHLNRVAHASWEVLDLHPDPVAERGRAPHTWADVAVLIEELIVLEVRPVELIEIQTDLLVPLELEVCLEPCSPRQVYALAVHGIL